MANEYRRQVGLFSATMLITGSMIGAGIFIVGAGMVRQGGSGAFLLLAWGLTSLLTVLGALAYGELAGLFPQAGGQYAYLREIYGPLMGFLYGWTFFTVIQCGTIAAVGHSFGTYLGAFLPGLAGCRWFLGPWHLGPWQVLGLSLGPYHLGLDGARLAGVAMILLLSAMNMLGIRLGALVQNLFSVTKIACLAALVLLGLLLSPALAPSQAAVPPAPGAEALPFLAALLVVQTGSLFSSDAWNSITFIAAEVKEPRRTIPLALFTGTSLVCGLYLLAHVVFLKWLGPQGIAGAPGDRVGSSALEAMLGARGGLVMAGAILLSIFGCQNGLVLSGARVYQAMARHGLFPEGAGRLNARGVPAFALALQALWASLLVLSGSYGQLLDFVIFAALLFYVLTVAGVFVLRVRRPELERPVKAFGYPLLPALYLAGALGILGALLVHRPAFTWPGLVLAGLGAPVYWITQGKGRAPVIGGLAGKEGD